MLHTFHNRKSVREKVNDNVIKTVNLHDGCLPPYPSTWEKALTAFWSCLWLNEQIQYQKTEHIQNFGLTGLLSLLKLRNPKLEDESSRIHLNLSCQWILVSTSQVLPLLCRVFFYLCFASHVFPHPEKKPFTVWKNKIKWRKRMIAFVQQPLTLSNTSVSTRQQFIFLSFYFFWLYFQNIPYIL